MLVPTEASESSLLPITVLLPGSPRRSRIPCRGGVVCVCGGHCRPPPASRKKMAEEHTSGAVNVQKASHRARDRM